MRIVPHPVTIRGIHDTLEGSLYMGIVVRLTLLFLLITLASSCAKRTLVALVPDPDGRTGSISVLNEAGSVAIDAPYLATTIGDPKERPAAPVHLDKKVLDKIFAEALSIESKRPLHFQLYFVKKTRLAHDSEKLLPEIIAAIRERKSAYISVIGHTDTLGTEDWNMELSKNRALTVKDLLVKQGVDSNTIWTTYRGQEYPMIPSGDNVWEPRNRRVEVIVR